MQAVNEFYQRLKVLLVIQKIKMDRIKRKRRTSNRYCTYCHMWSTKKAWTLTDGKCPRCHGPLIDPVSTRSLGKARGNSKGDNEMEVFVGYDLEKSLQELKRKVQKSGLQKDLKLKAFAKRSERVKEKRRYADRKRRRRDSMRKDVDMMAPRRRIER